MYTKKILINDIKKLGISPNDTLLVHSSMKAIGNVEGGADTVIDAFMEYINDWLLIFPTLTYRTINENNPLFNPSVEPSCVGILTNIFMKRKEVVRSLHPTHSIALYGKKAKEYIKDEEKCTTPCPKFGCWGRLYDMGAKILFLGCSLTRNTFIHSIEEWYNVPQRMVDEFLPLKCVMDDGKIIDTPMRRHDDKFVRAWDNYDKIEEVLIDKKIAVVGKIGNARSVLCDAKRMADLVGHFLELDKDFFANHKEIPQEWYK